MALIPSVSPVSDAHIQNVTLGRTARALQDDFSRYSNGALNGQVPIVGSAWQTTGAEPTTISSGRATSTGAGYAAQTFTETPTLMSCDVSFSGSDATTTDMTMAFCGQTFASGDMLDDLVHCNFGPTGFQLTLRRDAGSFDVALTGNWFAVVPMDGTVAHFEFAVSGDRIVVYGPYGETFGTVDRRAGYALSGGGNTVFWEPNTSGTEQAFLHEVSAFTTADSGQTGAPMQLDQLASIARKVGPDNELYANRYDGAEVRMGVSSAQNMPAISFAPTEIHAMLLADTIIGATTFQTNQRIPGGTTLTIGFGTNQEALTQNGSLASGSGSPYTSTTTSGATKAHTAGDPIIVTGLSSPAEMYFNTSNGFFYLPEKVLVVPAAAGIYFGDLSSRLYQLASGQLDMVGNLRIEGGVLKLDPIALPATCAVGDMCVDTADKKLKLCTAVNTWTVAGSQT